MSSASGAPWSKNPSPSIKAMKYHSLITTSLCGLVLLSGIAWAAEEKPRKPRQTRGRATEAIAELTEAGKKLEAKYADMQAALRTEITAALPTINDAKMYPIYAKCVELDLPIFVCAGIPGPRVPFACQHVELIDQVMYDFPELVFVTRHGCEPWEKLMMKLMLKWPNLYYSTSAFAPKYYPEEIVNYANTRGADRIIYAGYFPMGLPLERIMTDMPNVPFKDNVWPKFLRENAQKVLKIS